MRRSLCLLLLGCAVLWIGAGRTKAAESLQIHVATKLPAAARLALAELQQTLEARQIDVRTVQKLPELESAAIVLGIAGANAEFDAFLKESRVKVADGAESLACGWVPGRSRTLVLAGRDERGLTYAVRDVTRGMQCLSREQNWWQGVATAAESPFLL